jgi:putative toxin-antitoxin system antitoxin component (TIGR02293 family)
MNIHTVPKAAVPSAPGPVRAHDLLGGQKVLKRTFDSPSDAHELILEGLPARALTHFIGRLEVLKIEDLEKAIGMSVRTFQRRKAKVAKPLSRDQSGRLWKFAEILAKAIKVFGTQADAEEWLRSPAYGLDRRPPIEFLATPAGVTMVETYLGQMEYCVYI